MGECDIGLLRARAIGLSDPLLYAAADELVQLRAELDKCRAWCKSLEGLVDAAKRELEEMRNHAIYEAAGYERVKRELEETKIKLDASILINAQAVAEDLNERAQADRRALRARLKEAEMVMRWYAQPHGEIDGGDLATSYLAKYPDARGGAE
jgi:hypothetical protein